MTVLMLLLRLLCLFLGINGEQVVPTQLCYVIFILSQREGSRRIFTREYWERLCLCYSSLPNNFHAVPYLTLKWQALRLKWPSWADLALTIWELLWRRRKKGRPDLTQHYPFSLVTPGFNHSDLWDLKCVSTAICACMCRRTSCHLGQQLNRPPEPVNFPNDHIITSCLLRNVLVTYFLFPLEKSRRAGSRLFAKLS